MDGRLQNISGRNELTDEWKDRGAADKMGILTNDMSKEMLGVTIAEHRDMKGLEKKHELREQMDNLVACGCYARGKSRESDHRRAGYQNV